MCGSPCWSGHAGLLSGDLLVFAGACGCGKSELVFGGGLVTGSGVVPGGDAEDDLVVEVAAPWVFLAVRVTLGSAVIDACSAQSGEGDGIAPGLVRKWPR